MKVLLKDFFLKFKEVENLLTFLDKVQIRTKRWFFWACAWLDSNEFLLKFPKVSLLMTPSHVLWLNSPIDHDIEGLAHRDVTLCSTAVESAMEIAYRLFSSLSKWKLRTLLPYVRTLKLCNALWHAAYISSFVSCANPQKWCILESSRLKKLNLKIGLEITLSLCWVSVVPLSLCWVFVVTSVSLLWVFDYCLKSLCWVLVQS